MFDLGCYIYRVQKNHFSLQVLQTVDWVFYASSQLTDQKLLTAHVGLYTIGGSHKSSHGHVL